MGKNEFSKEEMRALYYGHLDLYSTLKASILEKVEDEEFDSVLKWQMKSFWQLMAVLRITDVDSCVRYTKSYIEDRLWNYEWDKLYETYPKTDFDQEEFAEKFAPIQKSVSAQALIFAYDIVEDLEVDRSV